MLAVAWPYSGGNFGDSAIIDTAILNLRLVLPGADIVGITLHPENMLAQHGVEGVTLSAVPMEFYGSGRWNLDGGVRPAFWSLGNLKRVIRRCRAVVAFILREIFHWMHAIAYARHLDAVIFPGSGQIDQEFGGPWGHPYAMFKWAAAARLTGGKVIVMSVGIKAMDSPVARWFSRRTLQMAQYASLRNVWSQEYARSELHVDPPPRFVPDLAFAFSSGLPDGPVPPDSGVLKIGVSPIAYGHPDMWPTPNLPAFENYVDVLTDFVHGRIMDGHVVTLFHTDTPDMKVSNMIVQRLQLSLPADAFERLHVLNNHQRHEVLVLIQSLDLVVASRLHGVILSHVSGKPVLAIAYARKVATHMAQIGQPNACIALKGVTLDGVVSVFNDMRPRLVALTSEVRTARDQWRGQVMQQFADVAAVLSGNTVESVRTDG